MAFLPEARAGLIPSDTDRKSASSFMPQRLPESNLNQVLFTSTVSPEAFRAQSGNVQERILIRLFELGNTAKISELRPDFEMDRPLTLNEKFLGKYTWELAQRNEPITPRLDMEDAALAQVYHTVYPAFTKEGLASFLENERQRHILYGGMFTPEQDIEHGGYMKFTAARRYRAILENHIEEEKNQQNLRQAA